MMFGIIEKSKNFKPKKIIKAFITLCLSAVVAIAAAPFSFFAAEAANDSPGGSCGDGLVWVFNEEEGTLTVSGKGVMWNFSNSTNAPWVAYKTAISTVIIENGVTSIGTCAFSYCDSLTSVTISDSVTSIGYSAFSGCSSLKSVTIPDGITSINNETFYECSSLTSITIPNSITSIGEGVFSYCYSLTSITIPESVTNIGYNAFYGCTALNAVYITSLESWCNISFIETNLISNPLYYAHNLYLNGKLVTDLVIPDGVTSIREHTFWNCSSFTSVTFSESVTHISEFAFLGCSALEILYIPENITSIYGMAFGGCSSLISLEVSKDNPVFHSSGNCIIDTKSKELIVGCKTSIIPPDGSVTSIGWGAFSGCTSVTIPDSVTNIEWNAFYGCNNLTLMVKQNSYALEYAQENDIHYVIIDGCLHTNTEIKNVKVATCTENGYSGDTYCADCGELISSGETIATLGHSYSETTVLPTYTEKGYVKNICSICGNGSFTYTCALCDFNKDGYVNESDYTAFENADIQDISSYDFDKDGQITAFDKTIIKLLTEGIGFNEMADVNNDGATDIRDLIRMKKTASETPTYKNAYNSNGNNAVNVAFIRKFILTVDPKLYTTEQ